MLYDAQYSLPLVFGFAGDHGRGVNNNPLLFVMPFTLKKLSELSRTKAASAAPNQFCLGAPLVPGGDLAHGWSQPWLKNVDRLSGCQSSTDASPKIDSTITSNGSITAWAG